jgi:hypothetical protein
MIPTIVDLEDGRYAVNLNGMHICYIDFNLEIIVPFDDDVFKNFLEQERIRIKKSKKAA